MVLSNNDGSFAKVQFISRLEPSDSSWLAEFKTCLFYRVTTISGMSSSSKIRSEPSVGNPERAFVTFCLLSALWTALKSNSIYLYLQRTCLPVASARFNIQQSSWWSLRNVASELSRYGRTNKIVQTTARHSCCVVASILSHLVGVWDQYQIGRDVFPSFWASKKTYPTFLSHASEPKV